MVSGHRFFPGEYPSNVTDPVQSPVTDSAMEKGVTST